MIVAVHQPHYLPWLRYMHKLASCDVLVLLDDTQYEKNGWQNRNRIKGPNGPVLLTVPVEDASFKPINEVQINNRSPWAQKHWKSILHSYSPAPYFGAYADRLQEALARPWVRLVDLDLQLVLILREALGISTEVVTSSSLGVPGRGTARLVTICRALGADQYLTGAFAAGNHLEADFFKDAGIEVRIQTWECPVYGQRYPSQGFVPDLSVVDLLLNQGPSSLDVLMHAGRESHVPVHTFGM